MQNTTRIAAGLLKLLTDIGTVKTILIKGNANLTLNHTAGFVSYLNATGKYINSSSPSNATITFSTYKRDSTTPLATNQTSVPIKQYDNSGTLTNLASNTVVAAHRIYLNRATFTFAFVYGQVSYANLATAQNLYFTDAENFIVPPALTSDFVLAAVIFSTRNATSFQTTTNTGIKNSDKFCGVV